MSSLTKDLKEAKIRKHVVTSLEYQCKSDQDQEDVYNMVHDLLENHLNEFAKVTYELEPENKIKVEVIENK